MKQSKDPNLEQWAMLFDKVKKLEDTEAAFKKYAQSGKGEEAGKYQKAAARTLIEKPGFNVSNEELMILWNVMGLVGEAGELANMVKKGILHRHGLDKEKLGEELGDCLWYIAALCTKLELDMEAIMKENIEKLAIRYPEGYSEEASLERVDVEKGNENS
jgi:NTP pyrophosphatase (non-canonical NTP hydrolase)